MSNSPLTTPRDKPHFLIRGCVSLVIVVYFAAVFATVTGIGSGRFAPPEICAEAATFVRPGLQPLNLDSAHRYYVPNPGAEPVLWIRITYESGAVQWLEWPSKRTSTSGLAHTRNLIVPQTISQRDNRQRSRGEPPLTPSALVLLSSLARFVAQQQVQGGADGHPDAIARMQFYAIDHDLITPPQIRAGLDFSDLRLRRVTYLGTYNSSGEKLGESVPTAVTMVDLAARMIEDEIAPALRSAQSAELQQDVFDRVGVPGPVAKLLQRQPQLVEASGDELREQLRKAVAADDNPQAPLRPGEDYREEWKTAAARARQEAAP